MRKLALVLTVLIALGIPSASAWGQGGGGRKVVVEGRVQEARVALVIGNAAYGESPLNNPANDARGMAQALRGQGFEVIERVNADLRTMRRAVAEFGERTREGGVALFYYSGHGLQVNGRNYLVPIGADIKSETYASAETLEVDSVLAHMDAAKSRVNVVVLDACRNNPFTRRFRSAQRGLAFTQAPSGTFIAYATSPGDVADDGPAGGYGIFTGELLRALREPLRIEDVFKRVTFGVQQRTQRRQTPWTASNLTGDFWFVAPPVSGAPPAPAVVASVTPRPLEPDVRVVPRVGSLVIRSLREPVEVWLGERRLGEAGPGGDLQVDRLQAGTHVVRARARRAGFKPWEKEVLVAADQRAELLIDIEVLGPAKTVKGDDGAEMVLVPAGEFTMGSNDYDNEKPPHRVHLDAFYIDKYETTFALYKRFMGATGRAAPNHYTWTDTRFNGDSQPVVGVDWNDAAAYCQWAGKRLPTEAEWEKAARGTDGRKYPWGEQWDAGRANSNESKLGKTQPVGSYASGVSPYGAHDMAGNVWEWVADWYGENYYKSSPDRNPKGPDSGHSRVLRGGSWGYGPVLLRSAFRGLFTPGDRSYDIGFRCARAGS